jgi:hypothetical protein
MRWPVFDRSWFFVLALGGATACNDSDVVDPQLSGGMEGSGSTGGTGALTDTEGQDTSQATVGADGSTSNDGGNDGDTGGTGGIEGEECQPAQQGLCETPGVIVHCYSGLDGTCGVGPCQGGTQICEDVDLDLGEWSACMGEVLPEVEVCDGIDNDCDGQVDESLGASTCGMGVCAHDVPNCADGEEPGCDPLEGASDEVCDGDDNDCDGDIDEGLAGMQVSCGVGPCEHSVAACVDGEPPTCDPFEGAQAEVCDGIDNDCDDAIDDDLGVVNCGLGVCNHDQQECVGGVIQACDPWDGVTAEVCDGLDNDCDGGTDEGFGIVSCGVGECQQDLAQCVGGMPVDCDPFLGAMPEVCDDGLDNDCDGLLDESCTCGNGSISGAEQCDGGDLGGLTCLGLGFDGGTLGCNPDCTYDTTGCYLCAMMPIGGYTDVPSPLGGGMGGGGGGGSCAGQVIETLTCSSTYNGQVLDGNSSIDGPYTCGEPYAPLDQAENEDVYEFTCQADGQVELLLSGMDCDLDIYVLDDTCNEDAGCLNGSTVANTAEDSVTFDCIEGETYYIIIEGYGWQPGVFPPPGQCNGGEGNYTLEFTVGDVTGGCLEDCDDGIDNDLDGPIDCADLDCAADPVCLNPCP